MRGLSNAAVARHAAGLRDGAGVAALARAPTAQKTGNDPALLERLNAVIAETETLAGEFKHFANRSAIGYNATRTQVGTYLTEYRAAYQTFSKTLDDARAEEQSRQALAEAMFGFMLGVGVGAVLPLAVQGMRSLIGTVRAQRQFNAALEQSIRSRNARGIAQSRQGPIHPDPMQARDTITPIPGTPKPPGPVTPGPIGSGGTAATNVGGEAAETAIGATGVGKGGGAGESLSVPAEFNADAKAAQMWRDQEQVASLLVDMLPASADFADHRVSLQQAAREAERDGTLSGDAVRALVEKAEADDFAERFRYDMIAVDIAISQYFINMDTPLLRRRQDEILREMWVRHLASIQSDKGRDKLWGNDTVSKELVRLGLVEKFDMDKIDDPRTSELESTTIDVRRGDYKTNAFEQAERYAHRLDKVGKLGVIVLEEVGYHVRMPVLGQDPRAILRTGGWGLYVGTMRRGPLEDEGPENFAVANGAGLKTGQRVMIRAVRGKTLEVEPVPLPPIELMRGDRRSALFFAGVDADIVEAAEKKAREDAERAKPTTGIFGTNPEPDAISGADARTPAPAPDAVSGADARTPPPPRERISEAAIRAIVAESGLENAVTMGYFGPEDLTPALTDDLVRQYGYDALIRAGLLQGPLQTADGQVCRPDDG